MDANDQTQEPTTIFEYEGTYGGSYSRDQLIRALREALAIVEIVQGRDFFCSPFRIRAIVEPEA